MGALISCAKRLEYEVLWWPQAGLHMFGPMTLIAGKVILFI